jgi:hypothetical protein
VQQAFGFLTSQVAYIEREVYAQRYPEIQYPKLIPVDTTAPEWAKAITYFSTDRVGQAEWFHHRGTDMRFADINRNKFEAGIEMGAIGYDYTLEELGQAMMVPGLNLTADKAAAARRAAEEFLDDKYLRGDTAKGWTGLINAPGVTVVNTAANGTGSSPYWVDKSGDLIAQDVNDALSGVYTSTLTTEMADTILMPINEMSRLATKRMGSAGETINVLEWLRRYNVYTQVTGQDITIMGVRGLENAGAGGDKGRMVVYRRDPQVLKAHMPMPHKFLPPWQTGPITFAIPGIMRTGPLEIRRPGAVRYVDGISTYAS